jgi:hypothetical protein
MSKKLPLTDFRAARRRLEPHEFALSDGRPDPPPSDLVAEDVWDEIVTLPVDVSIRISDHHGTHLKLLNSLWRDWIEAVGDPDKPDDLFDCMLSAVDCFQATHFTLLHGYYRAALSELRTAIEVMMIGTYGTLNPADKDYLAWLGGTGDLSFGRCRKRLFGNLQKKAGKWMFERGGLFDNVYQTLCSYAHSRPDASDGTLWQSNGPVYNGNALRVTFGYVLTIYASSYLLVRLARPTFVVPRNSRVIFKMDWIPSHSLLVRAFTDLYGKKPRPQLKA